MKHQGVLCFSDGNGGVGKIQSNGSQPPTMNEKGFRNRHETVFLFGSGLEYHQPEDLGSVVSGQQAIETHQVQS